MSLKRAGKRKRMPAATVREILLCLRKERFEEVARKHGMRQGDLISLVRGPRARRAMQLIREMEAVQQYMRGERETPDIEKGEWEVKGKKRWRRKGLEAASGAGDEAAKNQETPTEESAMRALAEEAERLAARRVREFES